MPPRRHWFVLAAATIAVLAVSPAVASAARATPAPVSHAHATAGSTSIQLSWRNPGGRHFAATVVRFAKGDRAPRKPSGGTRGGRVRSGGHALTIRHLRPATRYSFALFAYYGSGKYARRVILRATTAPDGVRLVQPFDHHSYVAVTWRAPRASSYAATIVRYAAGHHAPSSTSAGTGVHLTSSKATEARLTHLAPLTSYSVSIWTRDRHHQYSSIATTHFTTLGSPASVIGSVSGTVTDRSAHRLAGVDVDLADWANGRFFSTTTGADGTYGLSVPAGDYGLDFYGADATGGDSDATGYLSDGRAVRVARHTTRTVDMSLDPGSAISGQVTDAAGHPLRGVVAYPKLPSTYVQSDSFTVSFSQDLTRAPRTAADGTFTLRGLPAQALQVCYDSSTAAASGGDFDAIGYTGRCEHTAVAVSTGTVRALAPVALVQASGSGTVSGTVTDSAGHPAAGAIVSLRGHDSPDFGTAYTDAGGHYRAGQLAAGRYDVCVDPSSVVLSAAATGDALTCRFATADVHGGSRVSVNVRLRRGGAAAGRLTGPGGHPVAGAQVYLRQAGTDGGGAAVTDRSGQFEVKNLAPGRYTACFDASGATVTGTPTGVRAGCFAGGDLVEVRAGLVRLGIDAGLAAGGAVSGTVVTGDATHAPAADVDVFGESLDDQGGSAWGTTDSHGHYTLTGLATGKYDLCALRFNLTTLGAESCRSAVRVTAGRTTRNADITLAAAGSITVAVQDTDGHPVAGVNAVVISACGPESDCGPVPLFAAAKDVNVAGTAMTGADGTATFPDLPPTAGTKPNYAVCVLTYYGATTAGETSTGYLDDCTTKGTFGIKLAADAHPTVALTLQPAGAVKGRITDSRGHPLAGIRIAVSQSSSTDYLEPDFQFPGVATTGPAEDVTTDADGRYVVRGVQPGSRTVCVDAAAAVDATGTPTPTGFLDQCLGGQPGGTDDGTPVTVPAAATVDTGDLALTAGAGIAGKVVDAATGHPVARTQVIVFDDLGETTAIVFADTSGAYRVARLPADDDVICFWADRYRGQCYHGVAWSGGPLPGTATRVTTAAGAIRSLKDARLKPA